MTTTPEDLAETPSFTSDAFSEVLDIVHVRGDSARMLLPSSAETLTVPAGKPCVYIVDHGTLEITIGNQTPVELHDKQVALLLQGAAHQVVVKDGAAQENGEIAKFFWGSFTIDGDLAAKILKSLPQIIALRDLEEQPIEWIDMLAKLVLIEVDAVRPGGSLMVSRLLDLLLVQILRRWAQTDDTLPGWLAAANDERIARAVTAIHSDTSRILTNNELAEIAGMSVSSFADRFKKVMGLQPGAYIRGWRLDQAAEALLHSSATIESISLNVGYDSTEAFSRAFKDRFGNAPSAWRASRD
ncbi:MAG: AraC family transcriptional regulator [Pseudomonadota bacterium]